MGVERNRGLLLALAGIAVLLGIDLIAYRPTAPAGADAPLDRFSAARADEELRTLVGNDVPHPVGSAANAAVRNAIIQRLESLGYAPSLQTGFACNGEGECGTVVNIVAPLNPATPMQDGVLLAAHYDSVAAGPGASDDGVGVAVLLESARVLKRLPAPRHPVVLLITDGEESGLLGASLFVSQHPLAGKIKAVVNMDARGNAGPSLMFETGSANSWTIRLYGASVAHPVTNSIFYTVYKMLPNGTDFTVFKAAGYQGVNLAFVGGVSHYHTPEDNLASVSLSTLQHQGDNALASLQALAGTAELNQAPAEAVFFDVLGLSVVSWPVTAAVPAAAVLAALTLLQALLLRVQRLITGRQLLWGLLAVLVSLTAALVLCESFLFMLRLMDRIPPPGGYLWVAHPLPMQIGSVALAVFAAACCGGWLGKRSGFWGLWIAASATFTALNLALSLSMPGTSFITAVTSAAMLCAAMPACLAVMRGRPPSSNAVDLTVLLPSWIYFAMLIPSLLLLYAGLGTPAWPMTTAVVGLGMLLLLPPLAMATRRVRQRTIAASALLAAAGLSVTVLLPNYAPESPQRLDFEYWLDADAQTAHWFARPDSMRLPRIVKEAAAFDLLPHPRYAGSGSLGFTAPAAVRALPAPQLTLLSSEEIAAGTAVTPALTRYRLHLQSMRGAPTAFVVFPKLMQVHAMSIATPEGGLQSRLRQLLSGATRLSIDALPESGVDFSVDAAAAAALRASIYDVSYGLPEGSILQRSRLENATSSQDGDVTIVQHTVSLDPAAGR